MTERLSYTDRTARKDHQCNFCGCTIKKGEKYNHGKYKFDGDFFEWKTHKRCDFIATEIWDIADPEEGMSEYDFHEACCDFCRVFVCPDCPRFCKEYRECDDDKSYCLDRIFDLLQTHRLIFSKDKYGMICFKIASRKGDDADD